MLSMFKRQPANEPITIHGDIEIRAGAADVFRLLDFSSKDNALRARGFEFCEGSVDVGRFKVVNPDMPDVVFQFDVTKRRPGREITFRSTMECENPFGAIEQSVSAYSILPIGERYCKLELTETAHLREDLSEVDRDAEQSMLILSVHNNLARLKLHAEQGLDAAIAAG